MDRLAIEHLLVLIPTLPLLGAAINGLLGNRLPLLLVRLLACLTVLGSFLLSLAGFFSLLSQTPENRLIVQNVYKWIATAGPLGGLNLDAAFRLDPLSAIMCLVITGVGFLIHVYSVGYMAHDQSQPRYFAYLNLFTFSMLVLVMGNNLLLMFVGWEGVGLCSYLLIGFWFSDLEKAQAGMKAFVVNRIGDFGFLAGLLLLFWALAQGGAGSGLSLSYSDLQAAMPTLLAADPVAGLPIVTWVCLLFFVGACGKSAQIPLYVWLPDAMAGPTPVSALIHAATMVTAGVFMIVRLNFLYAAAPWTLAVVAVVGALTALLAALIALAQDDIKKVLAYSTISQLGYMFLAAGVSAYHSAIFHLTTHAFFKALLFLGAGSVIHAVGHNDMQKMGGLRKHLPLTFMTFLVAYLTICGLPPLAGFFSKDEVLFSVFSAKLPLAWLGPALGVLGMVVAGLTALYMTRLLMLTFAGDFRGTQHEKDHLHESPRIMTYPLVVLALLSALGGLLGLPEAFHLPHAIKEFLTPLLPTATGQGAGGHAWEAELLIMVCSTAMAALGIYLGYRFFLAKPEDGQRLVRQFPGLHKAMANKFYVDQFYGAIIVRPFLAFVRWSGFFDVKAIDGPVHWPAKLSVGAARFIGWEDIKVVDGLVNLTADLFRSWGQSLRRLQTGQVHFYLYAAVVGLLLLYLMNLLL